MNPSAAIVPPSNQRLSRRLAARLLSESPAEDEARVVSAFRRFLALLDSGDADARGALLELGHWHRTPSAKPYFLELLQAEAQRGDRKRLGVYYTPWPVAQWIVRRVGQLLPAGPLRIVDPACGAGVFLLAAAKLVQSRPGSSLIGYDLSADAVEVARELLRATPVSVSITQVNPLLAGEALAEELLSRLPASSAAPSLVILGNPPYANFGRLNRGPWIDTLVADYRRGVTEQKLNLTDDFIKFLRWGQYWVKRAGRGVLAMITSRTYLSGLTHRGMRRSLAEAFAEIEVVDLHGDGEAGDENIFPIRRGVAIGVFSRCVQASSPSAPVNYASLCGRRTEKLLALGRAEAEFVALKPSEPHWLFAPIRRAVDEGAEDYTAWPRLDEIFVEFISGVQTKNDDLFVDFDCQPLRERMQRTLTEGNEPFDPARLRPYVVGPFDRRWIYYDPRLLGRPRWQVMRHMVQDEPNLALIFMRQSMSPASYDHALVVDSLASDRVFYSRRGAPFLAPLWRAPVSHGQCVGNLDQRWSERCASQLGSSPSERSLFAYIYAVLHAPSYRRDHLAELQRDFPRIPWPTSNEAFSKLAELGTKLIACHLSPSSEYRPLDWIGNPDCLSVASGFPRLQDNCVQLNHEAGLRVADSTVWTFHVGGHRVLERWLKVRRGRLLSLADLQHLAWLSDVAVTTQQFVCEIDAIMALPS